MSSSDDPPMYANRCRKLYLTLLTALNEKMSGQIATMYLREWKETARCDHVVDLSKHRARIVKHLGDETIMNEIESFTSAKWVETRALQTMIHYREWHRETLKQSLSWSDWIWYHTRLNRW